MTASALAASLERIAQIQAHLPGPASVLLALVAAGAAFIPWLWPVTRHITVMAHEGAHATLGSALGRKVGGMKFDRKGNGETALIGSGGGTMGQFSATLVGYLGPSAFGIAAAALIKAGYIVAVLWIGLAALLVIMTLLRKSFGIVTVVVALVLLFVVAGFASVGTQVLTAYVIAWFLLVSGIRIITIHGSAADDAGKLHGMTKIPAGVWARLWLAGSVVALIFGTTLLI